MKRLPRDISGNQLAHILIGFGYRITRQTGSHMRLTTEINGVNHITIPRHDTLRVGTLASIIASLGSHHGMDRDELLEELFGE